MGSGIELLPMFTSFFSSSFTYFRPIFVIYSKLWAWSKLSFYATNKLNGFPPMSFFFFSVLHEKPKIDSHLTLLIMSFV